MVWDFQFLSMKLEAVNSRMNPGIEVFPPKEVMILMIINSIFSIFFTKQYMFLSRYSRGRSLDVYAVRSFKHCNKRSDLCFCSCSPKTELKTTIFSQNMTCFCRYSRVGVAISSSKHCNEPVTLCFYSYCLRKIYHFLLWNLKYKIQKSVLFSWFGWLISVIFGDTQFGQQAFENPEIQFGSQSTREYSRGASPEWLHMQIGSGGFERTSW